MNNFIISDSAVKKISDLNSSELNPSMLRIRVESGGCNGMRYKIELTHLRSKDDILLTKKGVKVVIDKLSIDFLKDSELIYVNEIGNSSFLINNPRSKSRCGCGSSFSF